MVFSSVEFLFLFLPLALALYYFTPDRLKNILLLTVSLLFYAWGEVFYVGIMLVSIVLNYTTAILIGHFRQEHKGKLILAGAVIGNLGLLCAFKYANFITDNINILLAMMSLPKVNLAPIHLPIGISFFTFQAMSYVIDVYRGTSRPQTSLVNVALYISLFPQLIAGPIVRYHDIDQQIMSRTHSVPLFATGVKRFIYGLGKKVVIANPLGHVADQIFSIPLDNITTPLIWLGVLTYSLQIYFDFSGYSDMAIGLGRMFGFRLLENFNYPYISRSIQEFWRRWHISLSRWFRDYLYIPLGGNRCSRPRMYFNLATVFFLCGLWHGASWNYVIWGLLHGTFLILERVGLAEFMGRLPGIVRHVYVLLFLAITWVFFRSESLPASIAYLAAMAGYGHGDGTEYYAGMYLDGEVSILLIAGIIFSAPVLPYLRRFYSKVTEIPPASTGYLYTGVMIKAVPVAYYIYLTGLLIICAAFVASGTYNPFIYFRF